MKVTVLILNWNGRDDTLECLASLEKQTYTHLEVLLIDNGSSDDSCKAIQKAYPHIELIANGENLGFAEGNNVGLRHALQGDTDAILLLNNDTIIEPDCLANFAQFAQENPRAIIGGRLCQYYDQTKFDHLGGFWNDQTANFDLIATGASTNTGEYDKPFPCDFVCGAALFAPRIIWEEVGLLEAKFFLIWEESDFCMRAKRAGFEVLYCPTATVYHKVSSSFVGGKPHTHYFWWRNRLLWIDRNKSKSKKRTLFIRVIFPELARIFKFYLLKHLQILMKKILRQPVGEARKGKLKAYRAALNGAWDYFAKRFGPAPAWIFKK